MPSVPRRCCELCRKYFVGHGRRCARCLRNPPKDLLSDPESRDDDMQREALNMFNFVDLNNDKGITVEEWNNAFSQIDADGNNQISRKEWHLKLGTTEMFDRIKKQCRAHLTFVDWRTAFEKIDVNRDGRISIREWLEIHKHAEAIHRGSGFKPSNAPARPAYAHCLNNVAQKPPRSAGRRAGSMEPLPPEKKGREPRRHSLDIEPTAVPRQFQDDGGVLEILQQGSVQSHTQDPDSHRTDEEDGEEDAVAHEKPKACVCGELWMGDATFCARCGERKPLMAEELHHLPQRRSSSRPRPSRTPRTSRTPRPPRTPKHLTPLADRPKQDPFGLAENAAAGNEDLVADTLSYEAPSEQKERLISDARSEDRKSSIAGDAEVEEGLCYEARQALAEAFASQGSGDFGSEELPKQAGGDDDRNTNWGAVGKEKSDVSTGMKTAASGKRLDLKRVRPKQRMPRSGTHGSTDASAPSSMFGSTEGNFEDGQLPQGASEISLYDNERRPRSSRSALRQRQRKKQGSMVSLVSHMDSQEEERDQLAGNGEDCSGPSSNAGAHEQQDKAKQTAGGEEQAERSGTREDEQEQLHTISSGKQAGYDEDESQQPPSAHAQEQAERSGTREDEQGQLHTIRSGKQAGYDEDESEQPPSAHAQEQAERSGTREDEQEQLLADVQEQGKQAGYDEDESEQPPSAHAQEESKGASQAAS